MSGCKGQGSGAPGSAPLVSSAETMDSIKPKLRSLIDDYRFRHSIGVSEMAERLAHRYGVDPAKAAVAGLIHDCAKGLDREALISAAQRYGIDTNSFLDYGAHLLHGPVGACMAREFFGVSDPQILHAISVHTTGSVGMNDLDLILFVSDYAEPTRDFPGVADIRAVVEASLVEAALVGHRLTLEHLLREGRPIHPDSIDSRNDLIFRMAAARPC